MRSQRAMGALALACACIELGARPRTVMAITGLSRNFVLELMDRCGRDRVSGRLPTKSDHLFLCSQTKKVEVSFFLSAFRRIWSVGNLPSESLVAAYRVYAARFAGVCRGAASSQKRDGMLSFDRCFDLVSRTFCMWGQTSASLMLVGCRRCGSDYVSTPVASGVDDGGCPYCRLRRRYAYNLSIRRYLDALVGSGEEGHAGSGDVSMMGAATNATAKAHGSRPVLRDDTQREDVRAAAHLARAHARL